MDSHAIVGVCKEMCPIKEYNFRKKHNLIHILEKTQDGHVDRSLCIKEFRRSAAGENLSNANVLRSGNVLLKTAKYLISQIAFSKSSTPVDIYEFVFDRLRSIRQDMVIQQLVHTDQETALEIFSICCRYYIYIDFKTKFSAENFKIDKHIHTTHLHDCLNSFVRIAFKANTLSEYSVEIIYSYLLLNLDSEQNLMNVLKNCPEILRKNKLFSSVVELCLLMNTKHNFYRMILVYKNIYEHCSTFTKILLCLSLVKVRTMFLATLCKSHSSKTFNFPLEMLQSWLFLSDLNSTIYFCNKHGLSCNEEKVNLIKSNFDNLGMFYCKSCPIFKQLNNVDVCFKKVVSP